MMAEKKEVVRFSKNILIQHIILMTSMIMLSITGLALKYSDSWLGRLFIKLEGGLETRGIIHRTFAVILILLGVYHLLYVMFTEEGHRELMKIRPTWKDFKDFWQYLGYSLFGKGSMPKVGKYDFRQKFQYWGVIVGFWVMVLTGFILWFGSAAMAVFPKWVIDTTFIFHGYGGLLIFLILFLYHLYNVHLNPDHFPMSKTWLTGRISIEELRREHPLEYEELFGSDTTKEEEARKSDT